MQICQNEISVTPVDLTNEISKMEKLIQFRQRHEEFKQSGVLDCKVLIESQESLQQRELLDNTRKFCQSYLENDNEYVAVRDPLRGHKITKECRTKMTDWMIEVCSSFKCSQRTYFLAVTILDKYMTASHQNDQILENRDIH